jgi:cytochrome c peroxidase
VVLARVEHVLDRDIMPPASFLLLHWNGALSDEEQQALYAWIRETRRRHYSTGGEEAAYATAPIQPLVEPMGLDPAKVALGERLFNDPRLSGDQTLSCSSCHSFELGGGDRNATAVGVYGLKGPRNVPTVFNAALNVAWNWDGRSTSLAEQLDGPLTSPIEMGATWPQVVERLVEDVPFRTAFEHVYPEGIARESLADAIAEYERSLITVDAPFDRFLRGEPTAIGDEAKAGHAIFVRAGCATCHVGPALGGQSFEVLGLRRAWSLAGGATDPVDDGRFRATGQERDRFRFKVPTLRNVALTAPYFHDGSVARLDEAVRRMAHHQLDVELQPREVDRVVSFLQSLTGTYQGLELH